MKGFGGVLTLLMDIAQRAAGEERERRKKRQRREKMRPPFAPIGVLSRWERGTMNYLQARTFAETFRLTFVRWPLTIVDEETLGLSKADLDRLREEEPERL